MAPLNKTETNDNNNKTSKPRNVEDINKLKQNDDDHYHKSVYIIVSLNVCAASEAPRR